ncbi:MAG: hypothetical protein EP347_08420 [Alphaproteobacteria bacterium]|nr:MAG: hypothetical protein EP347_08420 [Alphaproteobacteria bacterium]
MNRIIFGLSAVYLAALAFIGYLWLSGPHEQGQTDNAPQTDSLVEVPESDAAAQAKDLDDEEPLQGYTADIGLEENASLRTNDAGIQIIKDYEGLRLEAYSGEGGWLIGYGHMKGVKEGQSITEAEAESLLREDLVLYENEVKAALTVPVNENEFSALVSLTYNIGPSALWSSTTLEELNEGNRQAAADAFMFWNKIRQDGELVQSMSLTARREAERDLFLTPVAGSDEMMEEPIPDEG